MLSDVEIVITRELARVTRRGFGKPLIFTPDSNAAYTECRSLTNLQDVGFGPDSGVYKVARALFSQNPSPSVIAVYGSAVGTDRDATAFLENAAGDGAVSITGAEGVVDLSGAAGNMLKVAFTDSGTGGLAVSYDAGDHQLNIDFGGEESVTCANLTAAIEALDNFTANTDTDDAIFTEEFDLETTAILTGGYDNRQGGIQVHLEELIASRNDWYFLLSDCRSLADAKALAQVAAGHSKIYVGSLDASVANHNQLAKQLVSNRAVLTYHDLAGTEDDPYSDASWVGRCAPEDPGSITWKFKNLNGVPAADVTVTEVYDLHDANVNTYISKLGVLQTSEGLTTSGEFIDITRGADWVEARMSERIHYLLFTAPKVPYTNRGFNLIKTEIEAVLQLAVTRGIVAVDADGNGLWEVKVPDREDTDPVDRANRILKDVYFEFDLAGAVHEARVKGVIRI